MKVLSSIDNFWMLITVHSKAKLLKSEKENASLIKDFEEKIMPGSSPEGYELFLYHVYKTTLVWYILCMQDIFLPLIPLISYICCVLVQLNFEAIEAVIHTNYT
jgi:hypothetical protein